MQKEGAAAGNSNGKRLGGRPCPPGIFLKGGSLLTVIGNSQTEIVWQGGGKADFVRIVAQEVSLGIERASLLMGGQSSSGRHGLSTTERIYAIEQILREYKDSADTALGCTSA
jgi:hypothetical protein